MTDDANSTAAEGVREFSSQVSCAAFEWIAAVATDDPAAVWRRLDPNFRHVLAQQWIYDNPGWLDDPSVADHSPDGLAEELAVEQPEHRLWQHCERVSMRAIRSATAGVEQLELGQGPRTRVIGVDFEVVHLIPLQNLPTDAAGRRYHPDGTAVPSLPLVMHLSGGEWKVAGIGPRLPAAGWPPTWTELPPDLVQ